LIVNIVNYSSTNRLRVLGAWAVLLALAAAAIASLLFDGLDAEARVPQSAQTDSQRVEELLERRLPQALREDVELLVLRGDDVAGAARALREAGVAPLPEQATVRPDRRAAILPFRLEGTPVEDVLPTAERLDAEVYGGAIVDRDFQEVSQSDLRRGEVFGVLAALVILVLVFGALVSALLPLVLAGVSIVVSLGIVALLAQAATLSIFVVNIVAGMGLALGIDYALFVVSRLREERAAGHGPAEAMAVAGATAARARRSSRWCRCSAR